MNIQPENPRIATDLLINFDFFGVEAIDGDLHQGWKRLHEGPEIFWGMFVHLRLTNRHEATFSQIF